LYYFIF
jgi:small subunit ribosomal protein S20e